MQREVNQDELSQITGYSTRQIRRLQREGLPHRAAGNQKLYPLPGAIDWIRQRDREEMLSDLEETDYNRAKAREKAAKARMAEIELAKEMGRLLLREQVDETYGRVYDRIRQEVLNMPGRWSLDLASDLGVEPREAEAILRRIATELLEEMVAAAEDLGAAAGDLPDDFPGVGPLREVGVTTFGDLLRLENLQSVRGIGPRTEEKIRDALQDRGLDAAA